MTLEKGKRLPILQVLSGLAVLNFLVVGASTSCTAGYYLKYGKVCAPCSPGMQ